MARKSEPASTPESGDDATPFTATHFDEKAWMRREMESARITFWAAGGGVALGILAWAIGRFSGTWYYGWAPILLGTAALGPALKRLGFSAESAAPKAMFGNWFLLFFTSLMVWILLANLL